jgi:hypothetical protein
MNVKIDTVATQFLFWEYLFIIFSIGSLQCALATCHWLNMELDLQSLFGLHVHCRTHLLKPSNPLPPAYGLIYEGAIGQPRYT